MQSKAIVHNALQRGTFKEFRRPIHRHAFKVFRPRSVETLRTHNWTCLEPRGSPACRVRMEAARALGCMASMVSIPQDVNSEQPGIASTALKDFYHSACYSKTTGRHNPIDFSDLAEYHVRLAVLSALARARTAGFSKDSVIDMLLDALLHAENRSSQFDSIGELGRRKHARVTRRVRIVVVSSSPRPRGNRRFGARSGGGRQLSAPVTMNCC